MPSRVPPVAALNLSLAALLLAVGLPGLVATALRLPSETTIGELQRGAPTASADRDAAAARLRGAAGFSNAARADLALALLAGDEAPNSVGGRVVADHAARELRLYLASVPDDSFAWANLAAAEMRRGTPGAAVLPFQMSVELAPASAANLLWRCGFGIDLYPVLDEAGRALLARQFQKVMDPTLDASLAEQLVALMKQKNAVALARRLMAGDDEAVRRFDSLAASKS